MTLCSPNPQVASYGVKPKYGLVTYATIPKVWVKLRDDNSSDADWVTRILNQISYEGQRSGKGLVGGVYFGVSEVKKCRVVGRGVVRPRGKARQTTLQSVVRQQAHYWGIWVTGDLLRAEKVTL